MVSAAAGVGPLAQRSTPSAQVGFGCSFLEKAGHFGMAGAGIVGQSVGTQDEGLTGQQGQPPMECRDGRRQAFFVKMSGIADQGIALVQEIERLVILPAA